VSVEQSIERASRARAVAGAPVDALLVRVEELTRRWAIDLIRARPLGAMAQVPLERLAREGPALCEQIARALDSDAALDRLARPVEPSGDERPSHPMASPLLVGADARSVVGNLEALRAILWEAVLEELHEPSPRLVADLADRLACVCSAALATMLEELRSAGRAAGETEHPRSPGGGHVLYDAPPPARGGRGAALIDEFGDVPLAPAASDPGDRAQLGGLVQPPDSIAAPSRRATAPPRSPVAGAPPREHTRGPARGRPRPWDGPRAHEPSGPDGGPKSASEDAVMRVSRGPGAPADGRS
jgi:hypothetical protein